MVSYHTQVTGIGPVQQPSAMGGAFDRQSMLSGCSVNRSVAPSLILHDFNGKKAKIIQTLKQSDDIRSGVVKTSVFQNLLSCLDVEIDASDLAEIQKKLGIVYQGVPYIKYEIVLRQMQYDNHSEKWVVRKSNDDGETLSVINEKTGIGSRNLRR